MNSGKITFRTLSNALQSILILGLMLVIFGVTGLIAAGIEGLVVAVVFGLVLIAVSPKVSPAMILKMYRASKISPLDFQGLYRILHHLSEKANLEKVPSLYYVPSTIMNAFSVGNKNAAAIALTDGILRRMNWREISGILAHEISHIQHNDLRIMGLADSISRFINFFSILGILMVALYLPFIIIDGISVAYILAVLLILFAPNLSVLLQLALSRTREFEADLNAVKLTGDPEGLASALEKIDHHPLRIWDIMLMPGRKVPAPSILRSHPYTKKRVQKLLELREYPKDGGDLSAENHLIPEHYAEIKRKPRWKIGGIWH